jgi:hypothetical protein
MLFSAIGMSITMLTLTVANPQNIILQIVSFLLVFFFLFLLVVFWFASITEVPLLSFSAFFVDSYVMFWEPVRIYRFSSIYWRQNASAVLMTIIRENIRLLKVCMRMLNARYATHNFALHMVVGQTSSITWNNIKKKRQTGCSKQSLQ